MKDNKSSADPRAASSTRRDFLRRSSAAATALGAAAAANAGSVKPSVSARSASRVIGANDRIQVGLIGVGGKGGGHLRALVQQSTDTKDIQVVAVNDVYTRRKQKARDVAKLTDKDVHHDYRELLGRNDVDAVFISTPDQWHAQMAIDSMAAGKDVYLQKPMTLTIPEARDVAAAAHKYKRVLQIGSQHLSDLRFHKAKELIERGEIGDLLWATVTYSRNSVAGEWNYYVEEEATPETVDWKRWLGPAPKRAFSAERYFRWRKYWDYSGGIATDLFYHRLGPVLYAMGSQFPVRVSGSGGIYVQKDREVPDTYATVVEYPNFYVNISASMANSAANRHFPDTIYGHTGTITFRRDAVVVEPESLGGRGEAGNTPAQPKVYPVEQGALERAHTDNFFACMRSRKPPVLNGDIGYQIMTAIKLGVDSYREGKLMCFDPTTQRVLDKAPERPGYEGDGTNHPQGYKRRA